MYLKTRPACWRPQKGTEPLNLESADRPQGFREPHVVKMMRLFFGELILAFHQTLEKDLEPQGSNNQYTVGSV